MTAVVGDRPGATRTLAVTFWIVGGGGVGLGSQDRPCADWEKIF
jgi:hypothetical protein